MANDPKNAATLVGPAILLSGAAANLGYGLYRMTEGREDNAPLFIAGAISGAMAAVLLGMRKRTKPPSNRE